MNFSQGGYTGPLRGCTVPVWRHAGHWCFTSPRDRENGAICDFLLTPEIVERFMARKE